MSHQQNHLVIQKSMPLVKYTYIMSVCLFVSTLTDETSSINAVCFSIRVNFLSDDYRKEWNSA